MSPLFPTPRAMLDKKPRHGAPCNRCGLCCVATLCDVARHLFKKETGPCPALRHTGDGVFGCGLVVDPAVPPALRAAAAVVIGTDLGCDARFNGEPRDFDFHQMCIEYDRRPDVVAARKVWGMP